MKPTVSVVITCHDLGRYLDEAVNSVLSQTMQDFEIIVVDDASTERATVELIENYSRPKTRVIRVKKGDVAAARNCGIRQARGKYICCLDADDVLEPAFLEKTRALLDNRKECGFAGCWYRIFGESSGTFTPKVRSLVDFLTSNPAPVCSLFRREAWERVGGYDETIAGHEDWELWINLLAHGYEFGMVEEILFRYRTRKGSKGAMSRSPENRRAIMAHILGKHRRLFEENAIAVIQAKDEILSGMAAYQDEIRGAQQWFVKRDEEHGRYISELSSKLEKEIESRRKDRERYLKEVERCKEEAKQALAEVEHLRYVVRLKEHEIRSLTSSKAWKLGNAFERAKHSLKDLLLLPFRIADLCCPDSVKSGIKRLFLLRADEIIKKNFYKFPFRLVAALTPRWVRDRIPIGLRNIARAAFGTSGSMLYRQERWSGPLVSVVIPCYNYGEYLEDALRSVLDQTFSNFEVIILDDGSTDRFTVEKLDEIEKRALPRVRIIRQENAGVSAARNRAISEARGKYICCLDADDKIAPTYLEKCLLVLESRNLDVCYSHVQLFGDEHWVWETGEFDAAGLVKGNCVSTAAVFRKSVWEKAGGYRRNMDHGWEDWDFWISVAEAGGRGTVIPEPLFLYRRHGETRDVAAAKRHAARLRKKIRDNHRDLFEGRRKPPADIAYEVIDPFVNVFPPGVGRRPDRYTRNILFVLPWMVVGGADFILKGLMETLTDRGRARVHIITTDMPLPSMGDSTPAFGTVTPDIYKLPNLLREDLWFSFIRDYIRSRNIESLFLCGSRFIYPYLRQLKHEYPFLRIVDQLFNDLPGGHVANNRRYSEYIDLTIVPAEKIRRVIMHRYGGTPESIATIYHGVDTNRFDPEKFSESAARQVFGIPADKKVILYVGRLSEEKNPSLFIDCAGAFRDRDGYLFVIRGNGPLLDELKSKVRDLGLSNVMFIGIVPEEHLPAVYSVASLLVIPSLTEGVPLTLFEALAMNVPVVATDVGGISDVIRNGENGFICRPGDAGDLVRTVRLALDTRFTGLRSMVKERYELRNAFERYCDTLERVLGGGGRA